MASTSTTPRRTAAKVNDTGAQNAETALLAGLTAATPAKSVSNGTGTGHKAGPKARRTESGRKIVADAKRERAEEEARLTAKSASNGKALGKDLAKGKATSAKADPKPAPAPKAPTAAELVKRSEAIAEAQATKEEGTFPLVFLLVHGADFRVHAPGCSVTARDLKNSDYEAPVALVVKTEREAILELWSDQIRETFDTDDLDSITDEQLNENSYVSTVDFHRCTKALPSGFAEVETVTPRAAKQRLAMMVASNLDQMVGDLLNGGMAADYFASAGMKPDEVASIVAHWIHHIPTDHAEYGKLMKHLPAPDRSDWR